MHKTTTVEVTSIRESLRYCFLRTFVCVSGFVYCLYCVLSLCVCVVPRFWFSRRWRLAVFSCVALLISTSQRVCLDVALVSMLNQTALVSTTPPAPSSSTSPPLDHPTSVRSRRQLETNFLQRSAVDNVTSSINENITATEASYFEKSPTSLHSTALSISQQSLACRNVTEVEFLVIAVFSYQVFHLSMIQARPLKGTGNYDQFN